MCECVDVYVCVSMYYSEDSNLGLFNQTKRIKRMEIRLKDSKQEVPARCLCICYKLNFFVDIFVTAKGILIQQSEKIYIKVILYKIVKP